MKHVIATGTDVATVCFFDPAALPPDFDERAKKSPYEAAAELSKQGRFWWQETGADGAYLFHFYVNEEVPERILMYAHEPQALPRFLAPSGKIWTCGMEYAARNPESSLTKFQQMGGKFELPAGDYSITAWRAEWPDEKIEKALEDQGVSQHNFLGVTTGVMFFPTLIATLGILVNTAINLALGELSRKYLWIWCVLLPIWLVIFLLMRKLSRLEKEPKRMEVENEFPSIVIQMKSIN